MDELQFFESSLSGEQIEDTLVGLRSINGYIIGNGDGTFRASTGIYDPSEGTIIRGGTTPPNNYTEGNVGELYLDASANVLYRCMFSSPGAYQWTELSYVPRTRKINNKGLMQDLKLTAADIPYKDRKVKAGLTDYDLGAVVAAFFCACGLRFNVAEYTKESISNYFLNLYVKYGGDIEMLRNNVFVVEE